MDNKEATGSRDNRCWGPSYTFYKALKALARLGERFLKWQDGDGMELAVLKRGQISPCNPGNP